MTKSFIKTAEIFTVSASTTAAGRAKKLFFNIKPFGPLKHAFWKKYIWIVRTHFFMIFFEE